MQPGSGNARQEPPDSHHSAAGVRQLGVVLFSAVFWAACACPQLERLSCCSACRHYWIRNEGQQGKTDRSTGPGRRDGRCFPGCGLWVDRSSALLVYSAAAASLLWCGWYLVPLVAWLLAAPNCWAHHLNYAGVTLARNIIYVVCCLPFHDPCCPPFTPVPIGAAAPAIPLINTCVVCHLPNDPCCPQSTPVPTGAAAPVHV